jgi:hypothetical protein
MFSGNFLFLRIVLCALVALLPYCVKCSSPVKESDKFCTVCGVAVPKFSREEYAVSGSKLADRVEELLHEGNVTRVIVKDETGKTARDSCNRGCNWGSFSSVVGGFRRYCRIGYSLQDCG